MERAAGSRNPCVRSILKNSPARGDRVFSVTPNGVHGLYIAVAGVSLGYASFHHLPIIWPALTGFCRLARVVERAAGSRNPCVRSILKNSPARGDRVFSVTPNGVHGLYIAVAGVSLGYASFHHLPIIWPALTGFCRSTTRVCHHSFVAY